MSRCSFAHIKARQHAKRANMQTVFVFFVRVKNGLQLVSPMGGFTPNELKLRRLSLLTTLLY